jgi:hypothetical protein
MMRGIVKLVGLPYECRFYTREGVATVVSLQQIWGMDLFYRFPGVIGRWIALPFDKVL